ncbi:tyrosine-type recombinase/integrase [Paraburkholderia dilworthii]|uniref:tyrosine-type recombinase/integrase n=1 Tax=Paraburkholderia dilworthii TaxID=948106 RepID=UPI00056647C7|nr:site-specific integrase [Paraburkholderia dilworthii]
MKVNIQSKTARSKLEPRREPYWARISTGVHVGYRKLESGAGTWIGRRMGEDGKYQFSSFGDGLYEFNEARKQVERWADELAAGVHHDRKTVADICRLYVENRRMEKGEATAYDAEGRFKRLVYEEPIGAVNIARLRPLDVERWRNAQLDDASPDDEESYKRAKDSVNRNLKSLKAALNYAKARLKLVSSDAGWKEVNQFPDVATRRKGWLTPEQRTRLLQAMPNDLRTFSVGLLHIGARPGELANANVADFDRSAGLLMLDGKTGSRKVPLSDRAREFFASQAKDKIGNAPLLTTADAQRWTAPAWGRAFREAREVASMLDAVMYCMRHTYISESIAQGIDVYTVAELTGTSVAIIQSNYGSFTDNIVERLNRVSVIGENY